MTNPTSLLDQLHDAGKPFLVKIVPGVGTFMCEHHGAGMYALMLQGPRQRKPRQIGWIKAGRGGRPTPLEFEARVGVEVRERTAPKDAPRYGQPGDGPVPIGLVGKLKVQP